MQKGQVMPMRLMLRWSKSRGLGPQAALLLVAAALWHGAPAWGQGARAKKAANEPEKVAGKIAKIERKGKTVMLAVEKSDGETLEVLLTPRLPLTITGEGDAGFLQAPKAQVTSSKVVQANDRLFTNEFTVHFGKGMNPGYQRDQNAADLYQVCGNCTAVDAESVTLNLGSAGARKIFFEQGAPPRITVSSNDPELLVEGANVEVEGTSRGSKFTPARVTVTLAAPLVAAEVFAKSDPRKAKAATSATKGANKKATKSKKGDSAVDESDPFGVLDKKEGQADKKTAKSDENGAKPQD